MRRAAAACCVLAALVAGTALAAPAGQAGTLEGATLPSEIAISDDGRYLAVSEEDGSGLAVWDTWSLSSGPVFAATCLPAVAVEFTSNLVAAARFYVACERGEVYYVEVDGSGVSLSLTVSAPIELNGGLGDVISLAWASGDDYIHALVLDSGLMSLHRISIAQDTALAVVAPQVVGGTPVGLAIGSSGTPVVVARTDGYLSWFDRSGDSYSSSTANILVSFGGVLSSVAVSSDYGLVFITDSGQSTRWSMPLSAPGQSTALVSDLAGAEVVALSAEDGELFAYTAGTSTDVEVYDAAGSLEQSIDLVDSSATSIVVSGAVSPIAYAAASDGSIRVLSDLPFIDLLTASPTLVGGGDPFTLSFSANRDGAWDVRIGGDGVVGSGSSLASGDLLAGEVTSVGLDGGDLTAEGSNRLYVFVTGTSGTGVDSTQVTLDQPPGPIDGLAVLPGDSRLVVDWTAGDESDLDHFTVYLSDQPFAADDAVLPSFVTDSVDGTISYPLSVTAGEVGAGHSIEITGLSNSSTYYVAVRAVDAGGLLGPVSEVVSATPEATCGAAECAGDNYGCSCSGGSSLVGPVRPAQWLAVLVLLGVLQRRRQLL